MRERLSYRLHAGTASILLVFLTLCLVSFAVLTLSGARADLRLSEKLADRTTHYYEAVSQAEDFIAEQIRTSDGTKKTVSADFPVSEIQYLTVTIELLPQKTEDASASPAYRILRYQLITDESGFEYDNEPLLTH